MSAAETFAYKIGLLIGIVFTASFSTVFCIPEQGVVNFDVVQNVEVSPCEYATYILRKTMYKDSYFKIKYICNKKMTLKSQFIIASKECANIDYVIDDDKCVDNFYDSLQTFKGDDDVESALISEVMNSDCNDDKPKYLEFTQNSWDYTNKNTSVKENTAADNITAISANIPKDAVAVVPSDGIYVMYHILKIGLKDFNVTVTIESMGDYGYLSTTDWPLLPFFRVMFIIYLFYTLLWIVLCCCHRKDLLRIQYWIGGVIFIGLIEKAVFLGEYETLNKTGQSVYGAVIFGELVSCGKKMLSRMLVIIVSVGFGIVKPRLGTTLHKILAVGLVYFIASSIEGCIRQLNEKIDHERNMMMVTAEIVLAVVDSGICWWIFASLVQTMRTLRVRRNVIKLSLYRHFMNTLIFAVLASVGFMLWSTIEHKFAKCLQDWKELWVDEAFWHLLFAIILLIITILWRPSANNQRYAYSPVTDAADDEAEEPMINEAFDGMKMRNKGQDGNFVRKSNSQVSDDLKWIEENIPSSIVDTALPGLLDSEEEIVTATYEMNKMQ